MEIDNNTTLTKSESITLKAINNWVYYKSDFNFLKAHKGLRESKLHLLIGTTGSGKSTVVRSILFDLLSKTKDKNILMLLSEETANDLKTDLAKLDLDMENIKNLYVVSEEEIEESEVPYIKRLEAYIKRNNIKIFIFDNITTSFAYNDMNAKAQFEFVKSIKAMTKKLYLTTLLIAHTGAQISGGANRMLNENDIRGSKSVVNLAEFLYIIQLIEVGETYFQTLRIIKHRSQNPDAKLFQLIFNKSRNIYERDRILPFDQFKDCYDKRNRL